MKINTKNKISYAFGIAMLVIGILLNHFGIGTNGFMEFSSLGNFLVYVGFISLLITSVRVISKKERKVDERMMAAALQAGRITILAIIITAFVIMIADGISPINIPYSTFMSYAVCFVVLANLVAYRLLLKYKY